MCSCKAGGGGGMICVVYLLRPHEITIYYGTTVEFRLPEGVEAVGEMQRPSGKVYNSAGTVVYEGEIEFRQEVSGQGTVTCAINYQCCNDQICMPPAELVLTAD